MLFLTYVLRKSCCKIFFYKCRSLINVLTILSIVTEENLGDNNHQD